MDHANAGLDLHAQEYGWNVVVLPSYTASLYVQIMYIRKERVSPGNAAARLPLDNRHRGV